MAEEGDTGKANADSDDGPESGDTEAVAGADEEEEVFEVEEEEEEEEVEELSFDKGAPEEEGEEERALVYAVLISACFTALINRTRSFATCNPTRFPSPTCRNFFAPNKNYA